MSEFGSARPVMIVDLPLARKKINDDDGEQNSQKDRFFHVIHVVLDLNAGVPDDDQFPALAHAPELLVDLIELLLDSLNDRKGIRAGLAKDIQEERLFAVDIGAGLLVLERI